MPRYIKAHVTLTYNAADHLTDEQIVKAITEAMPSIVDIDDDINFMSESDNPVVRIEEVKDNRPPPPRADPDAPMLDQDQLPAI